ncbi:MAG: glycosyltransferase [Actinomycetota bacterium]
MRGSHGELVEDATPVKILFATPVQPLANKPRPHHLVKGLAALGNSVHLLIQVPSKRAAANMERDPSWSELTDTCASVNQVVVPTARSVAQSAASLPTRTPLRVAYCKSSRFTQRARELIRQHECDVVHVHRDRLAPAFRTLEQPKVLDANDSMTLYLRQMLRFGSPSTRLLSAFELIKTPPHEARMAAGYAACLVTSEADAQTLRSLNGNQEVEVIPNGVDDRFFAAEHRDAPDSVLFVGTMNYAPNVDAAVWFARRVWPQIRSARPQTTFRIIGHKPVLNVRRLARIPGVEVTGSVPSVIPALESATVLVAPLRVGGGFSNKIAEALAAGVPTVATPVARAGIHGVVPGVHLLEGRGSEELAAQTLTLLEDASLRARLTGAGRELIRNQYRWERICARLEAVHRAAMAS